MRVFSWNGWNVEHIARHGVDPAEAEYVVKHAQSPFAESIGDAKWLVRGRSREGRWLQVIYVYPDDADVDPRLAIRGGPVVVFRRPCNGAVRDTRDGAERA